MHKRAAMVDVSCGEGARLTCLPISHPGPGATRRWGSCSVSDCLLSFPFCPRGLRKVVAEGSFSRKGHRISLLSDHLGQINAKVAQETFPRDKGMRMEVKRTRKGSFEELEGNPRQPGMGWLR